MTTTPVARNFRRFFSAARFHALRLLPGEDPVLSLRRLSAETGLRAGFIAGAVGSLSRAVLRFAGCPDGTVRDGCFEIVSLVGTLDAAGEHLHMAVSDPGGRVEGGHVLEGCVVRTTLELVVGELTDVTFRREPCPLSGYEELVVERTETCPFERKIQVEGKIQV